jgi:archaellum biogenesis protein FlaJ (TadC family)
MIEWIRAHDVLIGWLVVASVVTFVGTLIAVPMLIVRLPADYFAHRDRHRTPWADRHPLARILLLTVKNAAGALFVVMGILMLVLPGQGIVTMLIGITLLNFPGKFHLERWVVTRGPVRRAVEWLRRRAGREPLVLEIVDA